MILPLFPFRAQRALAILLVVLAGALAYAPALENDFLSLDDRDYIVDNPLIRDGLSFDSARWALTADALENTEGVDYWQPATLVSRLIDGSLYGLNPKGHHLTSVLIHLVNAVLLLLLLAAATGRIWRSAVVALVFATHPLHVSSVAWVAERKDVLSGLFSLASLAIFAQFAEAYRSHLERRGDGHTGGRALRWYLLLAAGYALCLMSKPMTLPLPLVMLLMAVWPIPRAHRPGLPRLALSLTPLLLLSGGAIFLYSSVNIASAELNQLLFKSPLAVAQSIVTALASYPARLFYPVNLQHLYAIHPGETPTWQIAGSLLLLCATTAAAAAGARRLPFLAVGWLWYLVSLLPVVPLFQSNAAADRFTYFPMIGVTVMIVWCVGEFAGGRWLAPRALVATAAVIALILTTRTECRFWKDSATLFSHQIELDPRHYFALRDLGIVLADAGEHDKALAKYQAAIDIQPNYPSVYNNMGVSLQALGRREEALVYFAEALRLDPSVVAPADDKDKPRLYSDIGVALQRQGRGEEALPYYAEALKLDPSLSTALYNMGAIHLRQGNFDAAISCFLGTLKINPNDPASFYSLGYVSDKQGRLNDAADYYRRALEIDPVNARFMNDLGLVYLRLGYTDRAAAMFQGALAIKPGDPEALESLRALGSRPLPAPR